MVWGYAFVRYDGKPIPLSYTDWTRFMPVVVLLMGASALLDFT
jgi:hypothetical protein